MKKVFIGASTNPPKEKNLIEYIKKVDNLVDFVHCDYMDGKFTELPCLSSELVKKINECSSAKLDVHIMANNPQNIVGDFAKSGANLITVHYEAFKNNSQIKKCLNKIKKLGCLCGLAINPETSVSNIKDFLPLLDVVLVMSVVPGKSGQKFEEKSVYKVKTLSQIRFKYNYNYFIEVDGGINNQNSAILINNGADILVSGSYLFNSKNINLDILKLKSNLPILNVE